MCRKDLGAQGAVANQNKKEKKKKKKTYEYEKQQGIVVTINITVYAVHGSLKKFNRTALRILRLLSDRMKVSF